jgi:hypothetical protein
MNSNRLWVYYLEALEEIKYNECKNYLADLNVMLVKYRLPEDVVATVLANVANSMRTALFPADDKYLPEDWSPTGLKWIKNLPKDTPISEGIETEKQFVVFKNYMAYVLPKLIFDVFRMFIADKKRNRHVKKELSALLSQMEDIQIEIEGGIREGWLNDVYISLIKILKKHLNSPTPKEKRIYGFMLNRRYKKWTKTELVNRLFEGLKKAGLIDPGTRLDVFRTIFDPDKEIEPVVWIGKDKNQLLYFFERLYELGILQKKGGKHTYDWKRMDRCFVRQDGKSWELEKSKSMFSREFKNNAGIKEDKKKPIDKIFDDIPIFIETQGYDESQYIEI